MRGLRRITALLLPILGKVFSSACSSSVIRSSSDSGTQSGRRGSDMTTWRKKVPIGSAIVSEGCELFGHDNDLF